jgi:glycosyltransferase involved in cell wall biosynthesis
MSAHRLDSDAATLDLSEAEQAGSLRVEQPAAERGRDPSIAIVHDYFTQRGGAERVAIAMHDAFPEAPVHTSLFDADETYPQVADMRPSTSWLDRVGVLRRHHRLALPLLAPTFSSMKVDADVVLCSSSGWAHGVRTRGRKVVYCHAPARWLYQTESYLSASGRLTSAAVRTMAPALRRWDRRAAGAADVYLANSSRTQHLLREAYGIDAPVVHPPCGIDVAGERERVEGVEPGYFLCVARLLGYKHVDVVMSAFEHLPRERLVVVGSGPDLERLRGLAPPNVVMLERVSDEQLRWLYASTRALVCASYEDFGLTPIEAATFGRPTVALRFGGYLDTIVEGRTGDFFEQPTPRLIADAVRRAARAEYLPEVLRSHARQFSTAAFSQALQHVVHDAQPDPGVPLPAPAPTPARRPQSPVSMT